MSFLYKVGIHNDGDYEEIEQIKLMNPVSAGDYITMSHGDDEWEVLSVVHSPQFSILHVKPAE